MGLELKITNEHVKYYNKLAKPRIQFYPSKVHKIHSIINNAIDEL